MYLFKQKFEHIHKQNVAQTMLVRLNRMVNFDGYTVPRSYSTLTCHTDLTIDLDVRHEAAELHLGVSLINSPHDGARVRLVHGVDERAQRHRRRLAREKGIIKHSDVRQLVVHVLNVVETLLL